MATASVALMQKKGCRLVYADHPEGHTILQGSLDAAASEVRSTDYESGASASAVGGDADAVEQARMMAEFTAIRQKMEAEEAAAKQKKKDDMRAESEARNKAMKDRYSQFGGGGARPDYSQFK